MNLFENNSVSASGPSPDLFPVTPDDLVDIPYGPALRLYVEEAGILMLVTAAGETRKVTVPAFHILQCGVSRVLKTGTTATGIHAFVAPPMPSKNNPPRQFKIPTGLGWNSTAWPLTVTRYDDGHDVGLNPRDLVDSGIWSGPAFHVDLTDGDDANTGAGANDGDFSDALRTIHAAFTEGNATGQAYRVLVNSGTCDESAFSKNGQVEPNQPVAIIGWGGPVTYRTGPWNIPWTLDQGTTYSAAITSRNRVFRSDVLTDEGHYTELTLAADLATCRSTVGTWFGDGTDVYVNVGASPSNEDIAVLRGFHGARFLTHADDLYLEDIHTQGGITGALHCNAAATRNIIGVDCSFRYSSPSNTAAPLDAVQIRDTEGLVAFWRSDASFGAKDCWNFHETNEGNLSVLLVDCSGHYAGAFDETSCNAFTTHDQIRAVVIGGDFGLSRDGADFHTIEDTKTWAFDVDVKARNPDGDSSAFKCSSGSKMWLESTVADAADSGNNYALEAQGGEIFVRGHVSRAGTQYAYSDGKISAF